MGTSVDTNGSRKVTINRNSTVSSAARKGLHFHTPLQHADNKSYRQSATHFPSKQSTRVSKTHLVDNNLALRMTLITDEVGARIKESEKLQVIVKHAASIYMINNMFKNAQVPLNNAHITIFVGSNSVHEFRRHRIITELLALIEQIRKVTSAWIYIASLVPRPVDHNDTAYTIRDFNHALKKAVLVAIQAGNTGIMYISNQQLFIKEDGSLKMDHFHKGQNWNQMSVG